MVITDRDTAPLNAKNCIYTIARLFGIPREEVQSIAVESTSPAKQADEAVSQPRPLTSNNLSKLDAQAKDQFFDALEF